MSYLALTIGPIVETLSESKKTKELFAGSYLFSFIMKNMLRDLKGKGYELIVPYHEKFDQIVNNSHGIGMFHDRFIVSKNTDKETIQSDVDLIMAQNIEKIVKGVIDIDSTANAKYADLIYSFFKNYFQISYLISDIFSLKNMNNILDVAELHREFSVSPDDYKVLRDQEGKKVNPLMYLQRKFHQSFLKQDALGTDEKSKFPSVLEVALCKNIDYDFSDESKNDTMEAEALKGVKNHRKYMALIQGDGDKIGAILKKMDDKPEEIKRFSEKLFDFTQNISLIAKEYNATVVYAGGDDLLAFSPVISDTKKTVFEFLATLDKSFKNIMKELDLNEANDVSLSFGVSLVYYKKPLYQGLNKALNNLFYVAKEEDTKRNRAVVELIKHSGQTYAVDMQLGSVKYKLFNELLSQELNADESALPHAVVHNIYRSAHTLKSLADAFQSDDLKDMLHNFFTNNFNKEIHKNSNSIKALQTCENLLFEFLLEYQDGKKDENDEKKLFEKIYRNFAAALSTIKHLRGDR